MNMIKDRYLTIKTPSEGIYKEKGSRFLSFALPVQSEKEVKFLLAQYKKQFFDARHICYAFRLNPEGEIYRSSDAGEPAHTAGEPIFNAIRSLNITNILVVVIRYFGGTKLGKSGLITAYKTAAEDCLGHAEIIEEQLTETINLKYSYPQTSLVLSVVNSFALTICSQEFKAECAVTVEVPVNKLSVVKEKLADFIV
jgi:uncharacterized YigZ family protein